MGNKRKTVEKKWSEVLDDSLLDMATHGYTLVSLDKGIVALQPLGFVYPPKKEVGHGEYGVVRELTQISDQSKWVIKLSPLTGPISKMIAYRDFYFMHALQNESPQVVPRVVGRCVELETNNHPQTGMIMEAFDCNVKQLMDRTTAQYRAKFPSADLDGVSILHERHLKQIINIVNALNRRRVVHGDLFLNQFLYRASDDRIVLADFGFAGNISYKNKWFDCPILGWPSDPRWIGYTPMSSFGPAASFASASLAKASSFVSTTTTTVPVARELQYLNEAHPIASANLMSYVNFWELDASLWLQNVYIWVSIPGNVLTNVTEDATQKNNALLRYGRLSQHAFPMLVEKTITKHCRRQEWNHARGKWVETKPCYVVAF